MKFLCVSCDQQMKLEGTEAQRDIGSLSVIYACPACGNRTAMLTNAGETQAVASLGVKFGSEGEASKCPFSDMLGETFGSASTEKGEAANSAGCSWTKEAEQRLDRVPPFIRPMAKSSIEQFAKDKGYSEIDEKVLSEAKGMFGLG